ncbi:MAG: hypothetical protein JG764_1763 [Clostridiales bacterium]|nr:hypothetical protein [Clostridiales bacterium]
MHPMREDAVKKFLERAEGTWDVIQTLISGGKIKGLHAYIVSCPILV